MKKKYTTAKYKKRNQRRGLNRLRRTLIYKEWRKNRNKTFLGVNKKSKQEYLYVKKFNEVSAPLDFSFLNQPIEVIKFINKLKTLYKKRQKTLINLKKIKSFDYPAVTVLVSVMFRFKANNIPFNVYYPSNNDLKKILIKSEFFKYLQRPIGNKIEYTIGKKTQMFTRANKQVSPELGLLVMAEASQTIWGEKKTCKGMQRVFLELMQNTNNHASLKGKGKKHWWLSINHDKEGNKVSFVFVDYGIGIFESLNSKPLKSKWFGWSEKISSMINEKQGNEKLLELLVTGQLHRSVTGQHFRGKGLPGIKEVSDRNQISNLYIISNDVFANVSNNIYTSLSEDFSGTFVYWELNNQNQNSAWIS